MKLLLLTLFLFASGSLYANEQKALQEGAHLIQSQIQTPLDHQMRTVGVFSRRILEPAQLAWGGSVSLELKSFQVSTNDGTVILGLYNLKDKTLLVYDTLKKQFVTPADHTRLKQTDLLEVIGSEG